MKDYNSLKLRILGNLFDFLFGLFYNSQPLVIKAEKIKKIVLLKFDRLGDTFLSLSTLNAFRKLYPQARIIVFCAPWNKEILENNPAVDSLEVIIGLPDVHSAGLKDFFSRRGLDILVSKLKEVKPDMAVDLQMSPLNARAIYEAKIKYRLGYRQKIMSFLFNFKSSYKRDWPQEEIYLSLPRALGYQGEPEALKLYVDKLAETEAIKLKNEKIKGDYVIFHLGAGRAYRQWPLTNFAALGNKILKSYNNLRILVIGSASDKALYEEFLSHITLKERVLSLAGEISLSCLYELLASAKAFVGNESGPGHLAASLNLPVISFMNPWSGLKRWQARGEKVSVLSSKMHNCQGPKCRIKPCPNMAGIPVSQAWEIFQSYEISKKI